MRSFFHDHIQFFEKSYLQKYFKSRSLFEKLEKIAEILKLLFSMTLIFFYLIYK